VQSLIEPPVRYSVGQEDFNPEIGRRLRIYCDGVLMSEVVEYDCEAGTVLKNKLDENGKAQLNAERSDILRETVKGQVTVEWEGEGQSLTP
jgi:hypothetical protein